MAADETRVDAADVLADWCWRNGFGNTDGHKAAAILAALREAAGGGRWTVIDNKTGRVWQECAPEDGIRLFVRPVVARP